MATPVRSAILRTSRTSRLSIRRLLLAAAASAVFLVSAEVTVRIEDFVLTGSPVWATPVRERDLVLRDELGIRGRPNGRYKKWHLNRFGFRNGPMSELPKPGVVRVMALGASETFGLYERDGYEYPAQLHAILATSGPYEVVNAATAGLALPGIAQMWENWGSRFKPAIVLIYPTPAFYLGEAPPKRPATGRPAPEGFRWPAPRLRDALSDRFDVPAFLQQRRVARWLAAYEANHPRGWSFTTLPADRLEQFRRDLIALVDELKADGARPIVMTHAVGFHDPPTPDETHLLCAWRVNVPRASEGVLLRFDAATAAVGAQVASERHVGLVDLRSHMNGHPSWFADDYVHFSEEGARVAASLIADAILGGSPQGHPPF